MQSGVAEKNFEAGAGGGIALEDGGDILAN
jgi:hypothetical protein